MTFHEGKPNNLISNTVILLVLCNILSKVSGFIRDAVLAYLYGTTYTADVFLSLLSLPDIIYDLITQAVVIGFIPIATKILIEYDNKLLNTFTNSLIILFELFGVGIIVVTELLAGNIISICMPGFKGVTFELACVFLRIMIFSVMFRMAVNVISAYLNIKKSFLPAASIGIWMNLVIIVFAFLSIKHSELLLAIGSVVAMAIQLVFIIPFARKKGYVFNVFNISLKNAYIKEMLIVFGPAFIATGANQLSVIVNTALASTTFEGGVALINYSNKLGFCLENIVVFSLSTVIYPIITKQAAEGKMQEFTEKVFSTIGELLFFLIPLSVGMAILAEPIIRLVFGRGQFVENDIQNAAELLSIYVVGMMGVGIRSIMIKALYAQNRKWIAATFSFLLLLLNIILAIFGVRYFSLVGIAAATTCTYLIGGFATYFYVYYVTNSSYFYKNCMTFFKTLVASVIMGIVVYFVYLRVCFINYIFAMIISTIIGIIIFIVSSICFHINEVNIIINAIKIRR